MNKTLVLFDFDGTLTKRDTFPQFVFFSKGYLKGLFGLILYSPFIFLFLIGLINGSELKKKLVLFYFKGSDEGMLKEKGASFIDHLIKKNGFNRDCMDKLKNHQAKGDFVCVVSASLNVWIEPFCNKFELNYLCTEVSFENGKCLGTLQSPNCNGTEKSIRIKQKYNLEDYSNIIAYGNSKGDKAMFELATEIHLIKK